MTATTPAALTIAGSDSSSGAGIQADLKTFSALNVYAATAVTAITAQNTLGVQAIHLVPVDIIAAQIEAVFGDLKIGAVKTGMLASEEAIATVVESLRKFAKGIPLVVDPVMVSTTGTRLLERGAEAELASRLIPLADLITPNLYEAAALLNCEVARSAGQAKRQAERLLELGARAVLLKGGHGEGPDSTDLLFDGFSFRAFSAPRIETKNTHGTGCTLASAIAAYLVRGMPMEEAVANAKSYVQGAIEHADDLDIGSGAGPVSHFYRHAAGIEQANNGNVE
jgi:hydroxymethylpyrimidine/phosphomethylpyrimidine kinase